MRSTIVRAVTVLALLVIACAGPSRSEMAAQDAEVKRMMQAHAVHLPKGVDPCVGVTLRLSDPPGTADAQERDQLAAKLTKEEIERAIEAAGATKCSELYVEAVGEGRTSPEPLQIAMSYGVDPTGKVCAVVERKRIEPVDPAAITLFEQSATCLKDALFNATFPAGRVKDKERIILSYRLAVDPVKDVKKSATSPGG